MKRETFQEATPDGIKSGNRIIGYSAAIRQLDGGQYDLQLPEGMRLLSYIWQAEESGLLSLSMEKKVTLWRWAVVAIFICDLLDANGTVDVPNSEGSFDRATIYAGKHGAMSVYPGPVRFSLANQVEGCAIEKYGVETGLPLALRMYQDMVETGPRGLQLSAMGREGMEMLHDSFIEMINTEGMPDMPVIH